MQDPLEYVKTMLLVQRNMINDLIDEAKKLSINTEMLEPRLKIYNDIIVMIDDYQMLRGELYEKETKGDS